MGINGVLQDLPLADVLQFVHLGQRTGTLYLWREDNRRAEIGFWDGRIVSAFAEGQRKLGDELVNAHLLERSDLDRVTAVRRAQGNGRTVGQILLEEGLVTREDLRASIRDYVQSTIFELVTWRRGSFHFEVDELQPAEDFSLAPGQALADLDLNTQMLLLEATRVHDEDDRDAAAAESEFEAEDQTGLDRRLRRAGFAVPGEEPADRESARSGAARKGAESAPSRTILRCQVITDDQETFARLREGLAGDGLRVAAIRLREAGTRLPGESDAPIVIADLEHSDIGLVDLESLTRTRPAASVVALAASEEDAREARRAGAVSVLRADDPTLVDTVRNLVRTLRHRASQTGVMHPGHGGFGRFRRVVFDVQSGLLSATMALNLMHVISESVERAILFLVQENGLEAAGAFGFSTAQEPLAEKTRDLLLEMPESGALRRALDHRAPVSVDFDEAELPETLAETVGRPASGQVVIFPVLGAEQVIALLYTDNGPEELEIEDIKILELATSQVGVAFENELLRRRLGDLDLDAVGGFQSLSVGEEG